MYCVTLRLHDIKKLTLVSVEYTMKVYLAEMPIFHLSGESPPPFHYSLGGYLYLFLLYILLSQN